MPQHCLTSRMIFFPSFKTHRSKTSKFIVATVLHRVYGRWCGAEQVIPGPWAPLNMQPLSPHTEYTVLWTKTNPGCELINTIIKEAHFKAIILTGCPNFADSITFWNEYSDVCGGHLKTHQCSVAADMHFLFCSLNSDSAPYLLPVNDAAFLSQTVKQICPTNHNSTNFTSGCVQLLNTIEQFKCVLKKRRIKPFWGQISPYCGRACVGFRKWVLSHTVLLFISIKTERTDLSIVRASSAEIQYISWHSSMKENVNDF